MESKKPFDSELAAKRAQRKLAKFVDKLAGEAKDAIRAEAARIRARRAAEGR